MKTLMIDLDGVVANFNQRYRGEYRKRYKAEPCNSLHSNDDLFWHHFKEMFGENGEGFFMSLEPFDGSREFYRNIRDILVPRADFHAPEFLTAIPEQISMPTAYKEKKLWVREHLSNDAAVHIGPYPHHKHLWAHPGDILIDDLQSNIDNWRSVGGIGILHTSFDDSLEQLYKILKDS